MLARTRTRGSVAAIGASVLEGDVFRSRLSGYQPSDLDQVCTTREGVWIGVGSVGSTDGRFRLMFRDQIGLLSPALADDDQPTEPIHDALRTHFADRGASFWGDLVAAAQAADLPYDDDTVHGALWDLVWAGEVTNNSLAPLRSIVAGLGGA